MKSGIASLARAIDAMNQILGGFTSWLALVLVVVQFAIVVMRYVFGVGFIFAQESLVYLHSLLFMLGAAFTLLHDGHVRVDIFYRDAKPRTKALVDFLGVIFLLGPVCVAIMIFTWPYAATSWSVFEGSKETSGIQAVFLLKSLILVFAALMLIQGVAMAIHAALVIAGAEAPHAAEEHEGL